MYDPDDPDDSDDSNSWVPDPDGTGGLVRRSALPRSVQNDNKYEEPPSYTPRTQGDTQRPYVDRFGEGRRHYYARQRVIKREQQANRLRNQAMYNDRVDRGKREGYYDARGTYHSELDRHPGYFSTAFQAGNKDRTISTAVEPARESGHTAWGRPVQSTPTSQRYEARLAAERARRMSWTSSRRPDWGGKKSKKYHKKSKKYRKHRKKTYRIKRRR